MSAFSDFFTQPGFWWGVPAGTLLGAVVTGGFSMVSTKKSDLRKIDQENDLDARKAEREQEQRNQAIVFEAASSYATTASDMLLAVVDENKLFNFLRDRVLSDAGEIDPNAMEKMAFVETQVTELKRLGLSLSNLKLFASTELQDAAVRVFEALRTVVRQTTEPMAKNAAMQAAAIELEKFVNVFRQERGLPKYETSDAARAQAGYMETLKEQVETFQEEARQHMRAAGFTSTPWD